jgi:hypothetical protein
MKALQTWLNLNARALIAAWLALMVFVVALGIVRHVLHSRGTSVRYLIRRGVRASTDWFFDNVIRIRLSKIIEWTSALGLISLLAGQAVAVVVFQEITMLQWASFLAAGQGFAGGYQMWCVVRGDLSPRIEATMLALSAWIMTMLILLTVYAPHDVYEAEIIYSVGLPLSAVQTVMCALQCLVLMRYQMYPQMPEAVLFAYAVVDDLERKILAVFKLPSGMQKEAIETIDRLAKQWKFTK